MVPWMGFVIGVFVGFKRPIGFMEALLFVIIGVNICGIAESALEGSYLKILLAKFVGGLMAGLGVGYFVSLLKEGLTLLNDKDGE
jgi:hypothetical protein